jgi:hypothetical protein
MNWMLDPEELLLGGVAVVVLVVLGWLMNRKVFRLGVRVGRSPRSYKKRPCRR